MVLVHRHLVVDASMLCSVSLLFPPWFTWIINVGIMLSSICHLLKAAPAFSEIDTQSLSAIANPRCRGSHRAWNPQPPIYHPSHLKVLLQAARPQRTPPLLSQFPSQ